jgi:acyl carrier protein phosphodiesterase
MKGGALEMGTFNSTKTFPYSVEDVAPVAQDVMHHFEEQDFEVTETNLPMGGAQVSIRKGGTFKAIIGMKTALNIKIEPVANGTTVDAGVGIFGQQAIPTAITLLVFWPVIIAQVWNMAHESNLDDEALRVAEESLKAHSSEAPSEATAE